MNKVTHRRFSVGFAYIAVAMLYMYGLIEINYYEAYIIIVLISQVGAKFPDYDHNWKNIADKDAVKFIINKAIAITGGKHRSRHTHSIDIFIISSIAMAVMSKIIFDTGTNYSVANVLITGFLCGWASHLFADSLTSDGIYLFCWSKKTIKIVPKKVNRLACIIVGIILVVAGFGAYMVPKSNVGAVIIILGIIVIAFALKYGGMRFKTGDEWEKIVQRVLVVTNIIIGVASFMFPLLLTLKYSTTMSDFIENIFK